MKGLRHFARSRSKVGAVVKSLEEGCGLSEVLQVLCGQLSPAHFTQAVLRTVSRTLYCPAKEG